MNTPHLVAAFVLDTEISKISFELSNKNHEFHEIISEKNLQKFGVFLKSHLQSLNLAEFRQCNVQSELTRFQSLLDKMDVEKIETTKNLDAVF